MAFLDIPEVGERPPGGVVFSRTSRVVSYGNFLYPADMRSTSDAAWEHGRASLTAPATTVIGADPAVALRGATLFLASGLIYAEKRHDSVAGTFTIENYDAFIRECTDWHMLFYSATCYLKVWWNLVVRKSAGYPFPPTSTVLSSDAQEWEWTGEAIEDECCCHANLDPANTATYNVSDYSDSVVSEDGPGGGDPLRPEDPIPPDPGGAIGNPSAAATLIAFYLENIRWSLVEGYTPPADGSANGFPA